MSGKDRRRRSLSMIPVGLLLAVIATAAFGMLSVPKASAVQSPPGCTDNAINAITSTVPVLAVEVGTVINYSIQFTDTSANPCDVTAFTAVLHFPNGTTLTVLNNVSITAGTSLSCPSADARCAPGPYSYTVAAADETGPVTGCPPVVGAATTPKQVTAYVTGAGLNQSDIATAATVCKTAANPIKLPPTVVTTIRDAANNAITAAAVGSSVHDTVAVTGSGPTPTGNVTFNLFTSRDCSGTSTPQVVALVAGVASSSSTTVTAAGLSYNASYPGDTTYTSGTSACEPLPGVNANIQLSPLTATNVLGATHILTCHINVDPGTGLVSAPAGTTCTLNIVSGPGALSAASCLTLGTTGSCTVNLTNATTVGTTVIHACTTVVEPPAPFVGGVSLTRCTGDAFAGDSANAQKIWIAPSAQGCSPGFWKQHPTLWDSNPANNIPGITDFTTALFNTVFGVTSAQSGLANSVTLEQALQTGGGGVIALDRHVVSALLASESITGYPFTRTTLIAAYKDAVGSHLTWTVSSLSDKLESLEDPCPFNAHGDPIG